MTAPLASLMPLSESIMNDKPAMYTSALCSGSAALRALQKLSPRADDVVVVSGVCGSIGHMAGLMAKSIYHAKVIGVDTEGKAVSLGERMADVMDAFVAALHDESGAEVFERAIRQACVRLRGDAAGDYGADSSVIASSEPGGFSRMTYYIKDGGSIMLLG